MGILVSPNTVLAIAVPLAFISMLWGVYSLSDSVKHKSGWAAMAFAAGLIYVIAVAENTKTQHTIESIEEWRDLYDIADNIYDSVKERLAFYVLFDNLEENGSHRTISPSQFSKILGKTQPENTTILAELMRPYATRWGKENKAKFVENP